MRGVILIIGTLDYSPWEGDLMSLGRREGFSECIIARTSTIEEAEDIFFENVALLIIAEIDIVGGKENLIMLKTEEMYRHIPVIVVAKEYNAFIFEKIYTYGADAVLTRQEFDTGMLSVRSRPLITSSALFQLKILHSSELQDKALLDFIQLDLLKPYVPRTIWDIIQENAEQQKIVIKEKELNLTLCFGDIKGFTTISQSLKPAQVINFLNIAYEVVTRHIYGNNGDIDKFIGDAFFAVFTNTNDAVRAMIGIQRELNRIKEEHLNRDIDFVQFRISIHNGNVIRGNVGGNERYDNTLIGDTVNTASRLEHEAPIGGILMSEAAAKSIGINLPYDKMEALELRGRDVTTYAFSLFDMIEKGYINEEELI